MTRMTRRLEDGTAAMDCVACAKQGVVCHLLSCRNRLKERVCDYEDVIQSNRLVEQKHGRWIEEKCNHKPHRIKNPEKWVIRKCSVCGYSNGRKISNYCPNCGAKMDGDGNG